MATNESNEADSPSTFDLKEFNQFLAEFKGESDRAAVVLGAAKIDFLLHQILSKYLVPISSGQDELLDGDSPLTTFSAKINLVFRLGIIDAQFAKALHTLRKIRNSFAHEVSNCVLDSGPHRDRVKSLCAPFYSKAIFKEFKKVFLDGQSDIKSDFTAVLGMIIMRLSHLIDFTEPVGLEKAWTLFPKMDSEKNAQTGSAQLAAV